MSGRQIWPFSSPVNTADALLFSLDNVKVEFSPQPETLSDYGADGLGQGLANDNFKGARKLPASKVQDVRTTKKIFRICINCYEEKLCCQQPSAKKHVLPSQVTEDAVDIDAEGEEGDENMVDGEHDEDIDPNTW